MNLFCKLTVICFCCFLFVTSALSQETNREVENSKQQKAKIESLLKTQTQKWNQGDLEGFMETYWKSEKLTFSSRGITTRGWKATLAKYKKNYQGNDKEMGHLTFGKLEIELLSKNIALVLGNWHLKMKDTSNNVEGNFSLVLKTIDGKWKIVHDHSSSIKK